MGLVRRWRRSLADCLWWASKTVSLKNNGKRNAWAEKSSRHGSYQGRTYCERIERCSAIDYGGISTGGRGRVVKYMLKSSSTSDLRWQACSKPVGRHSTTRCSKSSMLDLGGEIGG